MSSKDDGVDLEESFFHKEDEQKLQKLRAKLASEKAGTVASELKALHYLHCGKCGNEMDVQVFKGIEIDVCPSCGAVLLDPGELEELAGEDAGGVVKTFSDFFRFSRDPS
jgi:Zn-finger nucleic acid-binding protein